MLNSIARYFEFESHQTSFRQEFLAGLTTFFTMSYVIIVNPKVLEVAGIPFGPSMVATLLTSAFGALLMGLYARRPFAVAPYLGESAFVAYTVVILLGYSWQQAMGAIFLAGVALTLLTAIHLRRWLVESIPEGLRHSFTVGIGLFMMFIGLNLTGIVVLGVAGAPVKIGVLTSLPVMAAILNFVMIVFLLQKKVPGSILIGILVTSGFCFILGLAEPPESWFGMPPSLAPTFFKMDFAALSLPGFPAIVLTIFVMAFVDTTGSLIGVASQGDFFDYKGKLVEIEKPMMADALATTVAGLVGTTTAGVYIESASGMKAGGRTGFAAIVVACMFLLALFCAPLLVAVPAAAYGSALIVVGILMTDAFAKLNYNDPTEFFPAIMVIGLMCFTLNIGIGITAGFLLYPIFKAANGKFSEIMPGMWVLAFLSLLFYIFYPYS